MSPPIRIAISACILGQEVRYDGGHKHSRFLTDTFGPYVEYVPLCPEMELGLGVPRETLRLLEGGPEEVGGVRLVTGRTGVDHTEAMRAWAIQRCRDLEALDLQGAIVQKGSPSCGMERVRVYPQSGAGQAMKKGTGIFTHVLRSHFPFLPIEEDGRMNDPVLRENFIERVFAYRRIRDLFRGSWRLGDLVRFHTCEKMLLLAHDRPSYARLGKLVATAKGRPPGEVAREYEETTMRALARIATRRKHSDVLQHMGGHLKKLLDEEDRAELRETVERYRGGEIPLVVPITLLRHHVRKQRVEYLAAQTYLSPHPRELSLRNHV